MPVAPSLTVRPLQTLDQPVPWPDLGLGPVQAAIVHTVAYADVFDYPLTPDEIHRFLVHVPASLGEVRDALQGSMSLRRFIDASPGFVTLRGRQEIIAIRQRRGAIASAMWPRVERYASSIARLPFVRMVGVSGALSMANSEGDADIDYFIVTEAGRLWLCRAAIIGLVRLAARAGDEICPNYLVSEQALALPEHNLFTAHEFLQMAPLAGFETYGRMWRANSWAAEFLPNAYEQARTAPHQPPLVSPVRAVLEAPLRTPLGGWLERWEMARKLDKFGWREESGSAAFSPDWCKGHFLDHGSRTLAAFSARMQALAQM